MLKLKQTVIVEGKYDKVKISSLVEATIIITDGFGIFRDKEKLELIRSLAYKNGLILLTDSDAAGFRIRNFLVNAVGAQYVTHVYIPDLFGKERRKIKPGAEGKIGVEGVPISILREAFGRAGISFLQTGENNITTNIQKKNLRSVTKADFFELGLSGGENSATLRRTALCKMGLPQRMNVNSMLSVVNDLYGYEEFIAFLNNR